MTYYMTVQFVWLWCGGHFCHCRAALVCYFCIECDLVFTLIIFIWLHSTNEFNLCVFLFRLFINCR